MISIRNQANNNYDKELSALHPQNMYYMMWIQSNYDLIEKLPVTNDHICHTIAIHTGAKNIKHVPSLNLISNHQATSKHSFIQSLGQTDIQPYSHPSIGSCETWMSAKWRERRFGLLQYFRSAVGHLQHLQHTSKNYNTLYVVGIVVGTN